MVEQTDGPGGPDDVERFARQSRTAKDNWKRTIEDMRAIAADRQDNGFETITIPAGNTAPVAPGAGESIEWGLSHVVPGNKKDQLQEHYEDGEFTETGVYQLTESGHVFIVTECIDHDAEVIIYVAGTYRMKDAPALVRAAEERGEMRTQLRTLGGTNLATFEHDDVSAFFPDPEEFYAFDRTP